MSTFKPITSQEESQMKESRLYTQEELDQIIKARLKRERTKIIKIVGVFIKATNRNLQVLQEQLKDMG